MNLKVIDTAISQLCSEVTNLTQTNHYLEQVVKRLLGFDPQVDDEVEDVAPPSPMAVSSAVAPAPRPIKFFSDIHKSWGKYLPLSDLFIRYFTENCFDAHSAELNDHAFKSKTTIEKRRIHASYGRLNMP